MTASRLEAGDAAPDFTLPTDNGDSLALKDLRGRKVVLYAYPAAMTPGCTTQACDFRDSLASLQAAGYEVIGISPDAPAKLAKFRERDAITFPLVSDQDKSVLTAYGAFGEKQLYGKTVTGVIRSTFVIDENGAVEKALYNVKARGPGGRRGRVLVFACFLCRFLGSGGVVPKKKEPATHPRRRRCRLPSRPAASAWVASPGTAPS